MNDPARAIIRASYPAHVECFDLGEPTQDAEYGLVCSCGTILGFPEGVVTNVELPQYVDDPPFESTSEPVSYGVHDNSLPDTELASALGPQQVAPAELPEPGDGGRPAGHGAVERSAVVPQDPIVAQLTVIDPTAVYGPAEVEAQLVDIEARLERGQHFQRVWEERAYRTKLAYTLSNAKALIDTRASSADVRRAEALLACQQEYEDMMLAEMMVKAVRETMHNLRSQLSGYQTISRSVGAVVSGPHAGQRT